MSQHAATAKNRPCACHSFHSRVVFGVLSTIVCFRLEALANRLEVIASRRNKEKEERSNLVRGRCHREWTHALHSFKLGQLLNSLA